MPSAPPASPLGDLVHAARTGPGQRYLIVALAALDGIEAAEREIERQPAQDKERLSAVLRHDTDGGNVNRPDSAG